MELSLSRVRTVVEKDFFLQPRLFTGLDKAVFPQNKPTPKQGTISSSAFGFGSFRFVRVVRFVRVILTRLEGALQGIFSITTTDQTALKSKQNTKLSNNVMICCRSWTIRLTPEMLDINDGVRISLVREESDSQPHTNKMLARVKYRFFTGHGETKLFSELRQEMVGTEESPSGWRPDLQLSKLFRASLQVDDW